MKIFYTLLVLLLLPTTWGQNTYNNFQNSNTALASGDWIPLWKTANARNEKMSPANFAAGLFPLTAGQLLGRESGSGAPIALTADTGNFDFTGSTFGFQPDISIDSSVRIGLLADGMVLSNPAADKLGLDALASGNGLIIDMDTEDLIEISSSTAGADLVRFNLPVEVPYRAYVEGTWNGSSRAVTEDAFRDVIQALPTGGNVATDTIFNSKGDLVVGTADNTSSRLAVGTNGQVLVADSAEATGVKWATASGTGDVVGPASSTSGNLPSFNGTTGKLVQDSGVATSNLGLKNASNTWTANQTISAASTTPFTVGRSDGAADGTGQKLGILLGTGGGDGSGSILGHYSLTSGSSTYRQGLRWYDSGWSVENAAGNKALDLNHSLGTAAFGTTAGSELFYGKLYIGGTFATAGANNVRTVYANPTIPLGATFGAAIYDAAGTVTGTANTDHMISYQARSIYDSSGTVVNLTGFGSILVNDGGNATNMYGFLAYDPTGTGTVTNNYGLYVNSLTKGTNNYSIYTAGTTPSQFGGLVTSTTGFSGPIDSTDADFSSGTATVGPLKTADGKNLLNDLSVYGAGTAYTLTNTTNAVDLGTTDPVLVIDSAGTYLIHVRVLLDYSGATVSAETANVKLRRTNNTAGDVTNATTTIDLPVATTLTHSYGVVTLPPVLYTTTNTDDSLTIFANVSATLGAGSIKISEASIVAVRIR